MTLSFQFANIKIGLEVCLDHAAMRLKKTLNITNKDELCGDKGMDVHLVTSGT